MNTTSDRPLQKFAKDVSVIGIANLLVALSGLITLPLLTKVLGAYDYGIWVQANVTISLGMTATGLGLPYAMTRFLPAKTNKDEIQEDFYSVFSLVFLASLIISSFLIIFADFIAGAIFDGATQIVRVTGAIILIWSLDWVCLNLFRAFRQMKMYSIFMVADKYGQVGIIVYLISNGYGLFSIVVAVLAIRAVIFFTLFFLIKSQIGIRRPHFSRIKEYLSFGLPTIPGNISGWVTGSSDRYVIGYFLGASSVGIYSAAYAVGNLFVMVPGVLGFVLPPTLSKLYDEGRMNEVKTLLSYSLKYLLAIAIPFTFGAAILGKPVLIAFSTAEIAGMGYFIIPVIALSALFYSAYAVIGHILVVVKKTKITGLIWIIAAAVNLGLNIVVVPHLGIMGAALTTLVAFSLALGIGSFYSFKEFKFTIDWSFIIKSLTASAIMSLVIWRIAPQGTSATLVTVIAGVAIYGVAIFLLKGFNREEFKFFKELFHRGTTVIDSDKHD